MVALAAVAGACLPYAAAHGPMHLPSVAGFPFTQGHADPVLDNLSRRALEAHTTFTLDPEHAVEANQSDASLGKWLNRRVTFPLHLPDLAAEGWTLRGGRLVPGDLGPSALLVYQNGIGEKLSLYMARVVPRRAGGMLHDVDTNGVLAWTDGSVGYGLIGTRTSRLAGPGCARSR